MEKILLSILSLLILWVPGLPAQDLIGVASFYGDQFTGRPTASGELYEPDLFTAAHRTLPFGTKVEVTSLENGKSVTVKINDRGPWVKGRLIDLSKAAAQALEIDGTAQVSVRILDAEPNPAPVSLPVYYQTGAFRSLPNAQNWAANLGTTGSRSEIWGEDGFYRVYVVLGTEEAVPTGSRWVRLSGLPRGTKVP